MGTGGVRDGDGAGGGKGWSKGAPYVRCWVKGGLSRGAVGKDVETGGTICAEEEGGTKNAEGFTRFVRLLLDSVVSRSGIKWVDDRWDGSCKVGTVGEATMAGLEGAGIAAEYWYGFPEIDAFEALPTVIAVCNHVTKGVKDIVRRNFVPVPNILITSEFWFTD